jgi:hypothetical protein
MRAGEAWLSERGSDTWASRPGRSAVRSAALQSRDPQEAARINGSRLCGAPLRLRYALHRVRDRRLRLRRATAAPLVIASAAKQSMRSLDLRSPLFMDCFVASLLAMTNRCSREMTDLRSQVSLRSIRLWALHGHRHGRACPCHPRLAAGPIQRDGDARDKHRHNGFKRGRCNLAERKKLPQCCSGSERGDEIRCA